MSARAADSARIRGPLVVSAIVHGGLVAAMLVLGRAEPPIVRPPVYEVTMVAAPPGPRQEGVVRPPDAPTPAAPEPTPEPPAAPRAPETPPQDAMPEPEPARTPPPRQQPRATPNANPNPPSPPRAEPAPRTPARQTPAPTAGGGPEGGPGTDVANVNLRGIEFPFPGYLRNIVRQIAIQFDPPDRGGALVAEVAFNILRDGTVRDVRWVTRSNDFEFDTEARGAIERAAPRFGRLPDGFQDDVLTVYFRFDPRIIR